MQWELNYTTNSIQSYADITNLKGDTEIQYPDIALCLPRYSKMSGIYSNTENLPAGDCGYVSGYMSGADGTFTTAPVLTISYERIKSSNGIHLVGNRLSGDYANDVTITWYRKGTIIDTGHFTPNNVDYICSKKVARFDTITLIFNHTSRSYRYVWLAMAQVQRITAAGGLQVVYPDISLGAKADSSPASAYKQAFINMADLLQDDIVAPAYALCLPRYNKMDGTYANAPDVMSWSGYMSSVLSGSDRTFTTSPVIDISFGDTYSSTGITLTGNEQSGDYCSSINIKWYSGTTLLADQDFIPDAVSYFCEYGVDNYNRITITFLKTLRPYRFAFLSQIDYGTTRIYKGGDISDATCILEVSPISEVLSINEFAFDFKSTGKLKLQDNQMMQIYFDQALICNMYIKKGRQTASDKYHADLQDAIGILEGYTFYGGMYSSVALATLVAAVFDGTGIEYAIDDSFASMSVTGYLPRCTRRVALAQIGFTIGAIIDTSYDDKVNIYPYPENLQGSVTEDDIYGSGLTLEYGDVVTGVDLIQHKYTTGTEQSELYNGVLSSMAKIEFSTPMHTLSVTGGTIVSSSVNHAVITGTGATVILTGYAYIDTQTVMSHRKANMKGKDNIVSVSTATLVHAGNSTAILNRVAAYYEDNTYVKGSIIMGENEPGLLIEADTGYAGIYTGIITKCSMKFGAGKIVADVEVE